VHVATGRTLNRADFTKSWYAKNFIDLLEPIAVKGELLDEQLAPVIRDAEIRARTSTPVARRPRGDAEPASRNERKHS
jgi:hypothetical protein